MVVKDIEHYKHLLSTIFVQAQYIYIYIYISDTHTHTSVYFNIHLKYINSGRVTYLKQLHNFFSSIITAKSTKYQTTITSI